MSEWNDKKVTILGLGRSGVSAARYLIERGAKVFISDSSPLTDSLAQSKSEVEALGATVETGGHTEAVFKFSPLMIVSPGIAPGTDIIKKARALNKEIICDVELAYRETKTPIVAVTGTNGKSTTCALISFLLEKSGRLAPACGNFGVPVLSQLERKPDYLVVEVSSYQLEYTSNFAPQVAVWLNLTPDHLDWHGGLQEYISAKKKLFANQSHEQYAVLNMDDATVRQTMTRSEIFPFSATSALEHMVQGAFVNHDMLCYRLHARSRIVARLDELQIRGRHNVENALSAIATVAILKMEPVEISLYIKEFKGLEHRLEFVGKVDGIDFYNDSKATNPESAIKALESFPDEKVVLIAGGRDKGTSLDEFVHSVRNYAHAVILLGEAKERFEKSLREGGFESIHKVGSLEEAVDLGQKLKLGPVLLSPACASFDMFKDFENRGRVFKDIVRSRLEKVAPSVQG